MRRWCWPSRHQWEVRIIVPGEHAQIVTQVCARCGKGSREYREALGHYVSYMMRKGTTPMTLPEEGVR